MLKAKLHRALRVLLSNWPVHRLQEEMLEVESLEPLRLSTILRKHQLELLAPLDEELGSSLGTHAQPVDSFWRKSRPVGLDRYFERGVVQGLHKVVVNLQEWFAAR